METPYKKTNSLRALVAAIGCTLAAPSAYAISLENYLSEVVSAHPEVRQYIHRYRQVMQDQEIANKGWRPIVDLNATAGEYQTKSPITNQQERDYSSSLIELSVTQNLFAGYDTTYQIEQNEARLNSAMYMLYDQADNIALSAAQAYINALKQKRLVELAEENVQAHEIIYEQIQERTSSGVGRRSEVEQTAGRLAQARAGLIAQRNNLQDSLTELHKHLGRYIGSDELEEVQLASVPDSTLDELLDKALRQHPAMQVSQYNVAAEQAHYKRSKSPFMPQVDLQLKARDGEDLNGYDGPTNEYSIALNLKYNLYNGGADQAAQRKQISAVHEQTEYASKVRREVIETLRLAWMANKTLNRQIQYLEEHVLRARKTSSAYHEEVLLGHRNLTDLLDAKSELNNALKSHAQAIFDQKSAKLRIFEGYGQLFNTMALGVVIDDSGMRLIDEKVEEQDALPVDTDKDNDDRNVALDQCDNTAQPEKRGEYGCIKKEVIIENLNFVFDTTKLVTSSRIRLDSIIQKLIQSDFDRINVIAHTDWIGSESYNKELSQRRANTIREKLIEAGLDGAKIAAEGRGESEPLTEERSPKARAKNRRVEFILINDDSK